MGASKHDTHIGSGITIEGHYLSAADDATLEQVALSQKADDEVLQELKHIAKGQESPPPAAPDMRDLSSAGWGVVFATTADPRIRDALRPLLDHRQEQAARRNEQRYQEYCKPDPFSGKRGYYPGQDSPRHFLHENGVRQIGQRNPDEMPCYLLIVGDPATIPYAFQMQLGRYYAVGRIDFGDDLDAYARYAQSVVDAERGLIPRPPRAAFWAPRTNGDPATEASADHLVAALLDDTRPDSVRHAAGWDIHAYLHEQADKATLGGLLGGPDTPALLLAAGHGVAFPPGHERQLLDQGALLGQDWPGPDSGALSPDYYVASRDLATTADVRGLLALLLASYSGGTPHYDPLSSVRGLASRIADRPFLADLPRQLLAHPNGGALAVVAHTARLWGYTLARGTSPLVPALSRALAALMRHGLPVGTLCGHLSQPYAEAATRLSDAIYKYKVLDSTQDQQLIPGLWADASDMQHIIIIGDPAARIPRATVPDPAPPAALSLDNTPPGELAAPALPVGGSTNQSVGENQTLDEEPVARPRKEEPMSEPHVFNGVRIDGSYETVATDEILIQLAQGRKISEDELAELDAFYQKRQKHFSVDANVSNLSQTGWGVIFAHNADQRIHDALKPLLDYRREQAGDRYQEYYHYDEATGKRGFLPDRDDKRKFLQENGANTSGQVNPDQMPYYLLIVGDPQTIPYDFQYQMDVQYAVGRIDFGDDLDAYARYAQSVVDAAKGKVQLPRRATFWGVRTDGDPATEMSADHLITPLLDQALPAKIQAKIAGYQKSLAKASGPGDVQLFEDLIKNAQAWQFSPLVKDKAYKADLGSILTGRDLPALLFTASHGMAFPHGHERQMLDQGALLCQNWPGPGSGAIKPDYYFAGADIQNENANLLGLIAFFFACYGGGTPMYDQFAHATGKSAEIAERNFLADLPRQLLSHRNGGALAVVAHVERAWGYSFMANNESQLNVFKDAFSYLMLDGKPIGAAVELFNEQYAEKSTVLTDALEKYNLHGSTKHERMIPGLWTDNNDARGYIVIGDPAVSLPLAPLDKPEPTYATIDLQSVQKTVDAARSGTAAAAATAAVTAAAAAATPTKQAATPNFAADEQQGSEARDFGIFGIGGDDKGLSQSLKDFATKMSETLQKVVEDMTKLEVSTYVSENMNDVVKDIATEHESGKVYLRARSTIRLDGDTDTVLPMESGEIDLDIWEIHKEIVAQSQQNRNDLIEILLSLIPLGK